MALTSLQAQPPLGVRLAGGEVHLMGTAGGPHGGDHLHLEVVVSSGVHATVRSVAATVALPGDGRQSVLTTDVRVEAGASLRWLVEPLVVAAGADHRTVTTVEVHPAAQLLWREEVVLGRWGEPPGRLSGHLRVQREGRPLLNQGLAVGAPGWDGPAVTAGAGTVGLIARLAPIRPTGSPADGAPAAGTHAVVAPAPSEVPGVVVNRLSPDLIVVSGTAPDFATWRDRCELLTPSLDAVPGRST
ncbi:urease accessory protein UreD [Euzebya tangerina]|uniref:urease accessory protein UreD n=1 Tax=Euzebya tangerina TaxID=591198 RepID=UPI00196B1FFF|nr:urease accessory protein UreD [Euzebya tangerina]